MDQPSSKLFVNATQVLDRYYRSIVTKIAEEIVENGDEFEMAFPSKAEEIIDRYGPHLQSLAQMRADLFAIASIVTQQELAASGKMPGMPIAPSGRPIGSEDELKAGDNVLVEWGGSWWPGSVLSTDTNGTVRIHYTGWGDNWDEKVPRSRLQVDLNASPTEHPQTDE